MCGICLKSPCDSRCPNADPPKIKGHCSNCGQELYENYVYYTDENENTFCDIDCAIKFNKIVCKEWETEE